MVRTRLPKGVAALHPFETDQDVLHGVVQGMAHMKLSRDIWGRDYDGEGLSAVIHLRMKIFLLQPFLIQSVLQPLGVVDLRQFLAHNCSFLFLRACGLCLPESFIVRENLTYDKKPSADSHQQRASSTRYHLCSQSMIFRIPDCLSDFPSTSPLQTTGHVTLAAFTKWMPEHPPGSLPAGIKSHPITEITRETLVNTRKT